MPVKLIQLYLPKIVVQHTELLMTPSQCRAARGMLDLSQAELAARSNVGLSTVKNFEGGRSVPVANNLAAMKAALEAAGVQFIPENGGGAGVRLAKPKSS